LPEARAVWNFAVQNSSASNIKPRGYAFIHLVSVGLTLDQDFYFGQRCLLPFTQGARRCVPDEIAVGAVDITL